MHVSSSAILTFAAAFAAPCSTAFGQCEHPLLDPSQMLPRSSSGTDLVTGDFNDDDAIDVAGAINHSNGSFAGIAVWYNGGGGDGLLGSPNEELGFAHAKSIIAAIVFHYAGAGITRPSEATARIGVPVSIEVDVHHEHHERRRFVVVDRDRGFR